MKIKKLISILVSMDQTKKQSMSHEDSIRAFSESVDMYYQAIKKIEEAFVAVGQHSEDSDHVLTDKKTVTITVLDENDIGTNARVKFFPILQSESYTGSIVANRRIDVISAYSDDFGQLRMELPQRTDINMLPAGRSDPADGASIAKERGFVDLEISGYMIEISKGSEYSIYNTYYGYESMPYELCFKLERIANLKEMGWYAGDLHHHSIYSSPLFGGTDDVTEWPMDVKQSMCSAGLSFGALSDHHNVFNHENWRATQRPDFLPIVSKEISTSNGHVLSLNVREDVIYAIPSAEKRSEAYLIKEFDRITNEIRSNNGIAQINHPRDMQAAISLPSYMTPYVEIFDTMEIWNGSIPMRPGTTNDQALELWLDLLRQDRFIPATSGSDTHNTRANDYHFLFADLQTLIQNMKVAITFLDHTVLATEITWVLKLIDIFENTQNTFELWAKKSLGSGCVRTYVKLAADAAFDTAGILEALKKGRSFVTNGPILIPSIGQQGIGETVVCSEGKTPIRISLMLVHNEPLMTVLILTKKGILRTIAAESIVNTVSTMEVLIPTEELMDHDFLVFRAFGEHTHQVITNPIFIHKQMSQ